LKKYNIPIEVAEQLQMKSRSFLAITIKNDKQKPIAVALCESTKMTGINKRIKNDLMRHCPSLSALIESKCLIPSIKFAKQENI